MVSLEMHKNLMFENERADLRCADLERLTLDLSNLDIAPSVLTTSLLVF